MTTGDRIRYARLNARMTMEELGNKIGVKQSAINKYEKGIVVNLKRDTIAKLANALGVSPLWLLGLTDHVSEEEKLLDLFRNMNEEGRSYLLQTAEMASRTYLKKDTDVPREVG